MEKKASLNINQLIDLSTVVNQFINIFYNFWINDTDELKNRGIIKHFSKITYEKNIYKGDNFINLLKNLKQNGLQINISKFEFLDSGSRRIDISLVGTITNNIITKNFNQTFLLCHYDDKWYINNSILIIF